MVDNTNHVDVMTLQCEVADGSDQLKSKIASSLHTICKLKGDVVFHQPGTLANDGKIIDDIRTYE